MPDADKQTEKDEERVAIPLDPEAALRALLKVDPDKPVPQDEPLKDQGDPLA